MFCKMCARHLHFASKTNYTHTHTHTSLGIDRSGLRIKLPRMHPETGCPVGTVQSGWVRGFLWLNIHSSTPTVKSPPSQINIHTRFESVTYPTCPCTHMLIHEVVDHTHNYLLLSLFQSWWYLRGFGSFPPHFPAHFQNTLFLSNQGWSTVWFSLFPSIVCVLKKSTVITSLTHKHCNSAIKL